MPAARATTSTMVERGRRRCISILTTRHDLKTPDHDRLARSREHSCRQVGMRLRSASRVLENSYVRVRRSLRRTLITRRILNERCSARRSTHSFVHRPCHIDSDISEDRFLLYRCASNGNVTSAVREQCWRPASRGRTDCLLGALFIAYEPDLVACRSLGN